MGSVNFHPTSETLATYAAGKMDEARAVVVAAHAAACSECACAIADFEYVGGLALEDVAPVAMADDALEKIFARAAGAAMVLPAHSDIAPAATAIEKLDPLRAVLPGGLDAVSWKRAAPGLSQHVIEAQGHRPGSLRLFRIAPGVTIPMHTHSDEGSELTLILRGAYRDEIGEFRAGDLADLGDNHTHSPKAIGDEDCICLIATAGPLSFKTIIGRLAQPFVGL